MASIMNVTKFSERLNEISKISKRQSNLNAIKLLRKDKLQYRSLPKIFIPFIQERDAIGRLIKQVDYKCNVEFWE